MKRGIHRALLALIIMVQLFYTTYIFAYVKTGNHSDEAWSYGLANSYYDPFIAFPKGVDVQNYWTKGLRNADEWFSGQILKEYITVQPAERFAYGSVYYNNTYDVHPPLYHMLLHTVCSLFPDTFSWWYGFFLNAVFLIVTQIFLFLFVEKISNDGSVALVACALYAGGIGTVCTFTFIRQYTLLLALCMMFSYFCACFCEKALATGSVSRKLLLALGLCALGTFQTHYVGIAFVGVFTALTCLYLLFNKKMWQMFCYGSTVFIALELNFLIYPSAMYDIIHNDGNAPKHFSPAVQIRMLLCDLFEYNFGFKIGYFPTAFWNITIPLCLMTVFAIVMLLLPFRKEEWFGGLMRWGRQTCRKFCLFLRRANYFPLISILTAVVIYEWTAHSIDVFANGVYSMRYTCVALPYICAVVVVCIQCILRLIVQSPQKRNYIMLVLLVCVIVRVHVSAVYPYTFMQMGNVRDAQHFFADKNVMVVNKSDTKYVTRMAAFTPILYEVDAVCYLHVNDTPKKEQEALAQQRRIDYFLIHQSLFPLTAEESEIVMGWMDDAEYAYILNSDQFVDNSGGMIVIDEREDGENVFQKKVELLQRLCLDDHYKLVALIEQQLGIYYVLQPSDTY